METQSQTMQGIVGRGTPVSIPPVDPIPGSHQVAAEKERLSYEKFGLIPWGIPGEMRIYATPKLDQLFTALSSAEFKQVTKDGLVDFTSSKGRVQFAYANIDACLFAVHQALSPHGLRWMQPIEFPKGASKVVSILAHSSGQMMVYIAEIPTESEDPKIKAGLSTYLRRYQTCAVFGLTCAEDADTDGKEIGPPYTGSKEDRKWLVKILGELGLNKDQMKVAHEQMLRDKVVMTENNVVELTERIEA